MPPINRRTTDHTRTLIVGPLLQPIDDSVTYSSSLSSSPTLHDYDLVIARYSNSAFLQTPQDKWKEWIDFVRAGKVAIIWGIDASIQRYAKELLGAGMPSLARLEGDRIQWVESSPFGHALNSCRDVKWHTYISIPCNDDVTIIGVNGAGLPVAFGMSIGNGFVAFLPEFQPNITLAIARRLAGTAARANITGMQKSRTRRNQSRLHKDLNASTVSRTEEKTNAIPQETLMLGSVAGLLGRSRAKMNATKLAYMYGLSAQAIEGKKKAEILSMLLRMAHSSSKVALQSVLQGLLDVHSLTDDETRKISSHLSGLGFVIRDGVVEDANPESGSHGPISGSAGTWKYDVAISYASEDLNIATEIAEESHNLGIRVFLDRREKAELWGKDLTEWFRKVYGPFTRFVMVLVSEHYATKDWTDFEFDIAREEALSRKEEFILPVRLDDARLLGLRRGVCYLEYRKIGSKGIASALQEKLIGNESS